MNIDEIITELDRIGSSMCRDSKKAREIAKKAYSQRNLAKWGKYNAVARTYDVLWTGLMPLVSELLDHASPEFQKTQDTIPF